MIIRVPPINVHDGSMLTLGEIAEIERDGMVASCFEVPEIRKWFARNNPQHSHAQRSHEPAIPAQDYSHVDSDMPANVAARNADKGEVWLSRHLKD